MKDLQKYIQYALLLLIVVIGFCAYQFGYVKYVEKANAVKDENKNIEARVSELAEKESHREEWVQAMNLFDETIKKTLAKYGPGNTPEKSIMFVKGLEDNVGMEITSISFNSDATIFSSTDVDENGDPKVVMTSTSIAFPYTTTYEGLKKCMDYINNYPERMNVETFTANFSQENGQLSGNMIVNLYGVKDKDHVYTEPYTGDIELGSDNIFGTIDMGSLDELNANGGNTGNNAGNSNTGANNTNTGEGTTD